MAKIKFGKIERIVPPPKSPSVRKAAAKTKAVVGAKHRQRQGMQRPGQSDAAMNKMSQT